MKKLAFLLVVIFVTSFGFSQEKDFSFPEDAIGKYSGTLLIDSPRGKQDKIKHFVEDGLSYDSETGDLIPLKLQPQKPC